MTNEYKKSLIDYVTGLLNIEQENPTEFDPNTSIGTGDIDYNYEPWEDVITALRGKNACINGILENEFSDIFILYGGYQESGETSKGFLIYMNEYDRPVKIRLLDTRGFLHLEFDESSNRVYGVVSNRAVYDNSGDNESYFVYYNNLFLTVDDDVLPQQTYAYKIWNSDGDYFAVRDIVKHPDNSWYLIFSTDFSNLSSPRVVELRINVGEPNEITVWDIEQVLGDNYFGYAFYGWYSADTPHFKVIVRQYTFDDVNFILCQDNGTSITSTSLSIDQSYPRMQVSYIKVDYISIDENNIYFIYNASWDDNGTTKKQCYCFKYNGTSIETIYKTIIQSFISADNYPIPMMNIVRDYNRVYLVRFIYDTDLEVTIINTVNITEHPAPIETDFIEIGRATNKVYRFNIYNERTTLRRNFNILRFNSYAGYFREGLGDPNEDVNGFSNQGGGIKEILGYTGYPYSSYNVLVPRYANLYYLNFVCLFSRNFYNVTRFENTTTASVEVPASYINNYAISREKMFGITNYNLTNNQTNFTKNKYEILHINFINIINEIDEDTNTMYPLGAIKVNQNVTSGGQTRYDNTKCVKYRINYTDNTSLVSGLSWQNIDDTHKNTEFSIYIDKQIDSIDLISSDETTIYLKIIDTFTIGKYYSIKQKVRVE